MQHRSTTVTRTGRGGRGCARPLRTQAAAQAAPLTRSGPEHRMARQWSAREPQAERPLALACRRATRTWPPKPAALTLAAAHGPQASMAGAVTLP